MKRRRHSSTVAVRRGSVYAVVLIMAVVITMIGLSSIHVGRLQMRTARVDADVDEATALAVTAVEHALITIDADSSWRTRYVHATVEGPWTLGRGQFSWRLEDDDLSLSDDPNDLVRVIGTGVVGDATQMYSVEYDSVGGALAVMSTTLHTARSLTVNLPISTIDGPISTNDTLNLWNTVNGDAHAVISTGSGAVTGTLTEPAPAKQMPAAGAYATYKSNGTPIDYALVGMNMNGGSILSSTVNPYGSPDPNGVYFIDVPPSAMLKVQFRRVRGTLVVRANAGAKIKFDTSVIWEPHAAGDPIILVNGSPTAKIEFTAPSGTIDEFMIGANLNPVGLPYQGDQDNALDDTYPAEFRGLIHVIGSKDVNLANSVTIFGTIISECEVICDGAVLRYDPTLSTNPPTGFGVPRPGPVANSWRREFN